MVSRCFYVLVPLAVVVVLHLWISESNLPTARESARSSTSYRTVPGTSKGPTTGAKLIVKPVASTVVPVADSNYGDDDNNENKDDDDNGADEEKDNDNGSKTRTHPVHVLAKKKKKRGNHNTIPQKQPTTFLELLRQEGKQGLRRLDLDSDAHEFLDLESLQDIADRGFLEQWDSCALATAWEHHYNDNPDKNGTIQLQAVLMGGSSSARPAQKCQPKQDEDDKPKATQQQAEEDFHFGRYSNILQSAMNEDSKLYHPSSSSRLNWTIHNMAQGSTKSVWSGLAMQELLPKDLRQVDLLIWEHAINDHAPSADGAPHDMLRFWLTRVQHVFGRTKGQQSSIPPILILYLWEQDIGYKKDGAIRREGLGHEGDDFQKSLEVIQEFQKLFWPIHVIHLPKIILREKFLKYRREFLDDRHHPGCAGSHLIADILQYAIYANLAHASNNCKQASAAKTPVLASAQPSLSDLLHHPSTTIDSFTLWQPTLVNYTHSSLSISADSLQQASSFVANIFPAADMPGRDDRKFAFRLPHCESERLVLVVTVPTNRNRRLRWLGVVYAGRTMAMTIRGGQPVELTGSGANVSGLASPNNLPRGFHDWIDLDQVFPKEQREQKAAEEAVISFGGDGDADTTITTTYREYRLEFCDTRAVHERTRGRRRLKARRVWLHQLVGVTVTVAAPPESDEDEEDQ